MTNPFRCPKCDLPANDVDGDPFEQSPDQITFLSSMDVLCHCDNGHAWFEHADFSKPEIDFDAEEIKPPKIIRRYCSSAVEKP